jgi:NAD(P)-dependent dehydrogenase (short-subunit alcohol dehydrogenase family)
VNANDRDWLGLRDRVCVVTGAAGGIGRETAPQLAAAGAKVVAVDRDGSGCAQKIGMNSAADAHGEERLMETASTPTPNAGKISNGEGLARRVAVRGR